MPPTTVKKNMILPLTVVVIVSTALASGAVYAVQNKQNNDTQNNLQAQINGLKSQIAALPTATPTSMASPVVSTTTPDPTSGWKTYTSTDMGISFKYPSTWTVTTISTGTEGQQTALGVSGDDQADFTISTTLPAYDNQSIAAQYAALVNLSKADTDYQAIPAKNEIRFRETDPGGSNNDEAVFATGKQIVGFSTDTSAVGYAEDKNDYDLMINSFSSL